MIASFPPEALRRWCEGLGQKTFIGSSGRVFPEGLKASPLLRAWLGRLNELGVKFVLRHRWRGWNKEGALIFSDANGQAVEVRADATVLALGGASWSRLGSDGTWVDFLREQGIEIAPLRPANCGFIAPWSDFYADKFAGQPLKPVVLSFAGQTVQGEAMVTRLGLEGGAIYALSSVLREAIETTGQAILSLDLRPGLSHAELTGRLNAPRGSQSMATSLRKAAGLSAVAIGLMRESLMGKALSVQAEQLAVLIKETKIKLTSAADIARAISSAGGIRQDEFDANLMLKKKPGLFAVGEMLDWEAPTGGYLLQACFSTADTAAKGVTAYLSAG